MNKLLLLLLLFFCVTVFAQKQKTSANSNSKSSPVAGQIISKQSLQQIQVKLEEYMKAAVKFNHFSGSVLVARNSKPIFNKAYGMANYELNVPNTPKTAFRIGSVTKQFTAMAIMMLQESGKLNVNDFICKYLENCPTAWQPITIHHLLTNTSGIPNYTDSPGFWERVSAQPVTSAEVVNLFREKPLQFTPGEKVAYTNSGYYLLGIIIEKASGQGYAEFLHDNIFIPLGMKSSGYDDGQTLIPNRASGYVWTDKTLVNAQYRNMTILHSAGALYSTTEDLLLWDNTLYTEKLISRKSLNEIFLPSAYTLTDDRYYPNFNYKYGWYIGKRLNRQVAEHGGLINGYAANVLRYPSERVTIIFLSNSRTNQPAIPQVIKIGEDLSAIVFGVLSTPGDPIKQQNINQ